MKYTLNSVKGTKRTKNQDGLLVLSRDNISLFIVFDGVSSNKDSHVFIKEYSKIINKGFRESSNFINDLPDIFYNANLDLINMEIDGYSTICLLLFDNNKEKKIKFLNIGDSRIYNFTKTYLEKITQDHSLGEKNNILTKFLGSNQLKKSDFQLNTLNEGEGFLLCTDGFYQLMENNLKKYFKIINFKYLKNISKALSKEQAYLNNDDSTYIIIKDEI